MRKISSLDVSPPLPTLTNPNPDDNSGNYYVSQIKSLSHNTFTNTIHIYSDLPVVGLHEAEHAKDYAQRDLKAWASLARMLPLVPLFQEEVASSDAISLVTQYEMPYTLKSGHKLLYPAWGTYAGGELSRVLPGVSLLNALAAIAAQQVENQLFFMGLDHF
jgi:hypothetical protein